MFPACPKHKYVDLHREADEKSKETSEIEGQKQQDYEAEVKMYRALEQLKWQTIIVLHSFKYSHYQKRMWDPEHNAKNCSRCKKSLHADDGEIDFVVLGPSYIVLIEVKNAGMEASQEAISSFTAKATIQLDKLMQVISGIAEASDVKADDSQNKSESEAPTGNDKKLMPKFGGSGDVSIQAGTSSEQAGKTPSRTTEPLTEQQTRGFEDASIQVGKPNEKVESTQNRPEPNTAPEKKLMLTFLKVLTKAYIRNKTSYLKSADKESQTARGNNSNLMPSLRVTEDASIQVEPKTMTQRTPIPIVHSIKGLTEAKFDTRNSAMKADDSEGNLDSQTTPQKKAGTFKVFRFVAFPHSKLESKEKEVKEKEKEEKRTIESIFASDLDCFADWWQKKVIEKLKPCSGNDVEGDIERVKHSLLTVWATQSNVLDGSSIGLKSDVIATDKRLRESQITNLSSKKRPTYLNIVKTEDVSFAIINEVNIFNNILGIKYITKNQREAFERISANLVITGCAGSGKSLILIARFLHQALTKNDLKMVLLVFNQLKLVEYKNIFEKAEISFLDVSETEFKPKLWQSKIVVIHCNTQTDNCQLFQFLRDLRNVVVYVDDAHACDLDFSSIPCACIAVDFNQCHIASDQIGRPLWNSSMWKSFDLVTLTHNYRSTWNIVANLNSLSQNTRIKDVVQKNFTEYPPELSHDPSHGHWIYGPQTDIDVIHNAFPISEAKFVKEMLRVLTKRLPYFSPRYKGQTFTYKNFFIDPNEDAFYQQLVQQMNYLFCGLSLISVNAREQNIYSTEFGVCFITVVFSNMDTKMLRSLYNVMSRARAYCHIVVITDEKTDPEQLKEFLDIFKEAKVSHTWPLDEDISF